MGQPPTFHVFKPGLARWEDVLPGDSVISPGAMAYNIKDFHLQDDDNKKKVYHLARAPLLVLAVVPYGLLTNDPDDNRFSAYIVSSRHGILYIIWSAPKNGQLGT